MLHFSVARCRSRISIECHVCPCHVGCRTTLSLPKYGHAYAFTINRKSAALGQPSSLEQVPRTNTSLQEEGHSVWRTYTSLTGNIGHSSGGVYWAFAIMGCTYCMECHSRLECEPSFHMQAHVLPTSLRTRLVPRLCVQSHAAALAASTLTRAMTIGAASKWPRIRAMIKACHILLTGDITRSTKLAANLGCINNCRLFVLQGSPALTGFGALASRKICHIVGDYFARLAESDPTCGEVSIINFVDLAVSCKRHTKRRLDDEMCKTGSPPLLALNSTQRHGRFSTPGT